MPAGKYNLKIEQGSTFRQVLYWKNPDGTPINLTGYTARLHIRAGVSSSDVLIELTTENDGIVITPLDGKIELVIAATVTALIPWLAAVYDLEMVQGDEVFRLLKGSVAVDKEVTR